jgi:hypothetical protein
MRNLTLWTLIVAMPAMAQTTTPAMEAAPLVTPFSAARPGAAFPSGWAPLKINDQKKPTAYEMVEDQGSVVLHAVADGAASLLGHRTSFDIRAAPIVEWRWKIKELIPGADNAVASKEDSPVRIVLEFDGDKSKLPFSDRSTFTTAKLLSGRELPYATLMYIWSSKEPVGRVIAGPRTGRVQMVVASSGTGGLGAWQSLSRNALDDFRRAFKEEPGKLTGVAVLTDTDNTGEKIEGWYGDIAFRSNAR